MRELDSLAQKLPRLAAAVAAPQQRAEVDERPRVLEPSGRVGEDIDGLTQQPLAGSAALDQAEGAQRDADRARRRPTAARARAPRVPAHAPPAVGRGGGGRVRPPTATARTRDSRCAASAARSPAARKSASACSGEPAWNATSPRTRKKLSRWPCCATAGRPLDQPLRLGQLTALEEELGQVSRPVRLESGGVLERHSLDRPQILFCAPQIADLRAQQPPWTSTRSRASARRRAPAPARSRPRSRGRRLRPRRQT